jgi:hypothetical protein
MSVAKTGSGPEAAAGARYSVVGRSGATTLSVSIDDV